MLKYLIILILSQLSFSQDFQLVGKTMGKYSMLFVKVDIYKVAYYKSDNNISDIRLKYMRDVKKKFSNMGWKAGLKHIKDLSKLQWIFDNSPDNKKGDEFIIRKFPKKVQFIKNSKIIAETNDPNIIDAAHDPWIGPRPVKKRVKKILLGLKKL